MRTFVAIALLACAMLANAQDVLIRGATVHTVGEQGVLSNADVLVRDGKIAAVGTGLSCSAACPRSASKRSVSNRRPSIRP